LNAEYETELARDVAKTDFSFAARRRAIERIGLPEVRQYRLRQLDTEQLAWQQQVELRRQVFPQLHLHLVIEIQG
jgi:hypothetical protein